MTRNRFAPLPSCHYPWRNCDLKLIACDDDSNKKKTQHQPKEKKPEQLKNMQTLSIRSENIEKADSFTGIVIPKIDKT